MYWIATGGNLIRWLRFKVLDMKFILCYNSTLDARIRRHLITIYDDRRSQHGKGLIMTPEIIKAIQDVKWFHEVVVKTLDEERKKYYESTNSKEVLAKEPSRDCEA